MSRVVPWVNADEWRNVWHWLYSAQAEDRQKGVERVRAWRSRGRVPIAVDSTAMLVEVQLVEERFVNGMVDSLQKGAYAKSVASLAGQLGLADWLVDLRHEATHSQLPALSVLKMATEEALVYLRVHYWHRQATHEESLQTELKELLECFQRSEEHSTRASAIKDITQRVTSDAVARDVFIPYLLSADSASLVPSDRKQRPNSVGSIRTTAPTLYETYEPLLTSCHNIWPSFTGNVILGCVTELTDMNRKDANRKVSGSRLRTLACWAIYLLEKNYAELSDNSSVLYSVRTLCLSHPNPFVDSILSLATSNLSEPVRLQLHSVTRLHYAFPAKKNENSEMETISDAIIQGFLSTDANTDDTPTAPLSNGWRLLSDVPDTFETVLELPQWIDTAEAEEKGLVLDGKSRKPIKRALDDGSRIDETEQDGAPLPKRTANAVVKQLQSTVCVL